MGDEDEEPLFWYALADTEAGELNREDNVSSNMTYIWKYDMGGNLVYKPTFPLTAAGVTPSPLISYDNYSYGNAIWKDQLTSYKGQAISYDSSGNPTSYLGATLDWGMGRRLDRYKKGLQNIKSKYKGVYQMKALISKIK